MKSHYIMLLYVTLLGTVSRSAVLIEGMQSSGTKHSAERVNKMHIAHAVFATLHRCCES